MKYSPFIRELQKDIDARHLLKHPFYKMWEKGTLPIEVMRKYAEQYYHLEKNFPTFLSRAHTQCDDMGIRQAITDNLYDEEHGDENHRELWLRFGESIGVNRDTIENAEALPETSAAVQTFNELSECSTLEGIGGLAAYESQLPEISKKKIEGLQTYYGIDDPRGLQFFYVHGVMDIEHANAWWDILEARATSDEQRRTVREAVKRGRDALWNFLDGICRVYIPDEQRKELEALYTSCGVTYESA